MTFSEGGTITLVYPEGCAADLRGEFGTNAAFLPASLDGDIGAGPGVTSLGANAPAGYALYTVQGECRYVQYLTGPTFAGEFREPSRSCAELGADAAGVADAPTIPAWVQAYGRAGADAACLDGWNPSWQSWAEPVTGGWVCTRDIPSLG